MYEGKDEIHKYMQYEVSITVCMGRIANQRKIPKWLPFKNYMSESLNISCAYMGDICTISVTSCTCRAVLVKLCPL